MAFSQFSTHDVTQSLMLSPAQQRFLKRPRTEEKKPMFTNILCKIVTDTDYNFMEKNQVMISQNDYRHLFPGDTFEECQASPSVQRYVFIANQIYHVVCSRDVKEGSVWVNPQQVQDVSHGIFEEQGLRKVLLRSQLPLTQDVVEASNVVLVLERYSRGRLPTTGDGTLLLDRLDQTFKKSLVGSYLTVNQRVGVVSAKGVVLSGRVNRVSYLNPAFPAERMRTISEQRFALITPRTVIDYDIRSDSSLKVINPFISQGTPRCYLTVSLVENEDSKERSVPFISVVNGTEAVSKKLIKERTSGDQSSMVVPIEALYEKTFRLLQEEVVFPNYTLRMNHSEIWDMRVILNRIEVDGTLTHPRLMDKYKSYQEGLIVQKNARLIFMPKSDQVIFTRGAPRLASWMNFMVVDVIDTPETVDPTQPSRDWIDVSEFRDKIRAMGIKLVEGQKFNIQLSTGEFLIELMKASEGSASMSDDSSGGGGASSSSSSSAAASSSSSSSSSEFGDLSSISTTKFPEELDLTSTKKIWILNGRSLVNLRTNFKKEMDLVHNKRPVPLKKIKFQIAKEYYNADTVQVYKEEVLDAIHETMRRRPILPGQSLLIRCKGVKFRLVIQDFETTRVTSTYGINKKYDRLGVLERDTKIELEIKKGQNINITSKLSGFQSDNPWKIFEEFGLGGISEQNKDVFRNVILPRGKLSVEAKRRGVVPVKGILFYGPPGMGKTTLAEMLAKSNGCTEKNGRFQMIKSPSLFNKYLGNSEKNVREAFEKAKKRDGLNILVFDEFEAIAAERGSSTSSARDSVVTQILGEMDDLKEYDNIIVIAITNRKDILDPAIIRKGRFGLHLKFDIPDSTGRKEIFLIHTKKLEDEGLLYDDVDIDKLVSLTEGFSGADIKDLVDAAANFSLERLDELHVPSEELSVAKEGMLAMKDFEDALEKIKNGRGSGSEMSEDVRRSIYI